MAKKKGHNGQIMVNKILYTEYLILSNMNPIKNRSWSYVFQMGKQFLLH